MLHGARCRLNRRLRALDHLRPVVKKLLVAVVAAVVAVAGMAAETGAVWATATSTRPSDGHAVVYRVVKEFAPGFEQSALPMRFTFLWRYESSTGMPAPSERESMDRMEDLISSRLSSTGTAALVLVSTGEGIRRWIYYAKSKEAFVAELERALSPAPRFPVELHVAEDRDWSSYKAFKQALQE